MFIEYITLCSMLCVNKLHICVNLLCGLFYFFLILHLLSSEASPGVRAPTQREMKPSFSL